MILASNENNSSDEKIAGLFFLTQCWITYPIYFEENKGFINDILANLKRCTRDHGNAIKLKSI